MKRHLGWLPVLALAAVSCSGTSGSRSGRDAGGWRRLFDGKTLAGWHGDPAVFSVRDGAIVGRANMIKENTFLASDEAFADFVLRLKFQLASADGNSGVQFRSEWNEGHVKGYQADIGPKWWGALYEERGRGLLVKADQDQVKNVLRVDGWNDYEISARGHEIVLTLNGLVTARYTDTDEQLRRGKGIFAFQAHAGYDMEVRFKDVEIREIP